MPVKNKSPCGTLLGGEVGRIGQRYPQSNETKYRSLVMRYLQLLNKSIKAYMPEMIKYMQTIQSNSEMHLDAADPRMNINFHDPNRIIEGKVRQVFNQIEATLEEEQVKFGLEAAIGEVADETQEFTLREWRQIVRKTMGLDIREDYFRGADYDALLSSWTQQNVSFIKSINRDCLREMEQVVMESFTVGKTIRQMSKDIQNRFDVTKSKARLLARDQMGTLNSQITQTQHRSAGVSEYEWSDSGDERVRDCHAELNGKKFRYDEPPAMWYMTKHGRVYTGRHCNPGEDYQCRCIAKPVFDIDTINRSAFN